MTTLKQALEQAFTANLSLPAYPIDRDAANRYPHVNPENKYSMIDTAFAHRLLVIDEALKEQPESVRLETQAILTSAVPQHMQMRQAAAMLHQVDLAEVLTGSSLDFTTAKRQIISRPQLQDYHKSVTCAEHMAGLNPREISQTLTDYCKNVLGHPFNESVYRERRQLSVQTIEQRLPFPSKSCREQYLHYSDPNVLKASLRSTEMRGPSK